MTNRGTQSRRQKFAQALFNSVITYVPSHGIRQNFLRLFGAEIGRETSINRGSTVYGIERLVIGDNCSIGFDVMLDARGGLVIDDAAVIASDSHLITGRQVVDGDDFEIEFGPIHLEHHTWVTSRVTVLPNVTIAAGAVVGACSLVTEDVPAMATAAGVPAKIRGTRESTLDYQPFFRPLLY